VIISRKYTSALNFRVGLNDEKSIKKYIIWLRRTKVFLCKYADANCCVLVLDISIILLFKLCIYVYENYINYFICTIRANDQSFEKRILDLLAINTKPRGLISTNYNENKRNSCRIKRRSYKCCIRPITYTSDRRNWIKHIIISLVDSALCRRICFFLRNIKIKNKKYSYEKKFSSDMYIKQKIYLFSDWNIF